MPGKLHLCTAIHRWDQPLRSDTWLNRIEGELQLGCCDADLAEKSPRSTKETKNLLLWKHYLENGLNSHKKYDTKQQNWINYDAYRCQSRYFPFIITIFSFIWMYLKMGWSRDVDKQLIHAWNQNPPKQTLAWATVHISASSGLF